MKVSSFCSHDLKMIIFYWGHAHRFLPELWPFVIFFSSKSCLFKSFNSFHWILITPPSYLSPDQKRIILYQGQACLFITRVMAFFSVLAILMEEILVTAIPPTFCKGFSRIRALWLWRKFLMNIFCVISKVQTRTPVVGPFGLWDLQLNKLGKGPQSNAYQIKHLSRVVLKKEIF